MNKAKLLTENFGMYGIGNFDLTLEDINTIIAILNKRDEKEIKILLKELYEQLARTRLG